MTKEQKKTCDVCGGTGQVSFFKGVSRFLLSTEECMECAGTGYQLDIEKSEKNISGSSEKKKKKSQKRKN